MPFLSDRDYDNPLWDVDLVVNFISPTGRRVQWDGYWDGNRDWQVTVSLDEPGTWRWESHSSDPTNTGFYQQGTVACEPYAGDHPLYRHGPLCVSADGTHLEHADGTPFFWLADTAWNGVMRGGDQDWDRYLAMRADQQYTVIHFVSPNWRGDAKDEFGLAACTEDHPIRIHPQFFQEKDRRVAMINEHGLIASPVLLWSLLESDLGYKLPEADAIRLARYIVARYGAYQLVWLLGGDGDYAKMGYDRFKHIGRGVFANRHDRLVTLHPCGQSWPNEQYRDESWMDLLGYQSGHGDAPDHVKWLIDGPVVEYRENKPQKPVINLEPNYEGAFGYQLNSPFTDYHVRRASYWSCLLSPTAGVTYGHDSIWNWNKQTGPSEGHGNWGNGAVEPWQSGLDTPGIRSMTVLRKFFESLDWSTLKPAPQLLATQPGDADAANFIAVAQTDDGKCVVAYTPVGGKVDLDTTGYVVRWFDPRTGKWSDATDTQTPDDQDWLLVLNKQ